MAQIQFYSVDPTPSKPLARWRLTLAALALLSPLVACGGGGSGSSSSNEGAPVATEGGSGHLGVGLISMVPGDQRMRLDWRVDALEGAGPALALFVGTDPGNLLSTAPIGIPAQAGSLEVPGLANGVEHFAVLGVSTGSGWQASGPVLRSMPGAPIFARLGADPGSADGATPQTAFATLEAAVAHAASLGAGNVWVRSGTYATQTLVIPRGVRLYGGFSDSFVLAERNVDATPTVLEARTVGPMVLFERADGDMSVMDGFRVFGRRLAEDCLAFDQRAVELRQVSAAHGTRGFNFYSQGATQKTEVRLIRCTASNNRRRGVTLNGPYELFAEDCTFAFNNLEGLAGKDQIGLQGMETKFTLRDCLFQANGSEGLELELVAAGETNPGSWRIQIEDCEFLDNKSEGCLIDCDFEGLAGWFATLEMRGCRATRNEGSGIQLDMDAACSAFLNRCVSSSNQRDGLLITSETTPGTAIANACVFMGNQGYGAHTTSGDVGLVLSHSILAGNVIGGFMAATAPGAAVSTATYLQPFPWYQVTRKDCVELDGSGANPFEQAPNLLTFATFWDGQSLRVQDSGVLQPGDQVEVGDDGVVRSVLSENGGIVALSPNVVDIKTPISIARFAFGSVLEDWRPASGSRLIGAGLGPVGGPDPDVGVFGAPSGGFPGSEALVPDPLFYVASSAPAWSEPIGAFDQIVLRLSGGLLDAASLFSAVRAVDAQGAELSPGLSSTDTALILSPPGTGWPNGAVIYVHANLRSQAGFTAATTTIFPLVVQ